MSEVTTDTWFAFQPLVNLRTSAVVAIEMLARPQSEDVRTLLRSAQRAARLEQLDVSLAVAATRCSAQHETLLPLHLNLLADTLLADPKLLDPLHRVLARIGRRPTETVLEINPPYGPLDAAALVAAMRRLCSRGYRVALDGVGAGQYPFTLLADAAPDLIKLDREIIHGLPDDSACAAMLDAMVALCDRIGTQLVAEGVERPDQLEALRDSGVGLVQGNLMAPPNRRPITYLPAGSALSELKAINAQRRGRQHAARLTDLMSPALTLAESSTAEDVRRLLASRPTLSSAVLVDEGGRPTHTVDRNRFLLAVSGAYGHALHARRDAARLADPARTLDTTATVHTALDMMHDAEPHRTYDDLVITERGGRCVGVLRVADLVRGIAELDAQQAAACHPLTGLTGSDALADALDVKLTAGEVFAVSWIDVDDFNAVNDQGGFAAGDDLIRDLGRGVIDAAGEIAQAHVCHLGGDDFIVVSDLDAVVPFGDALLDMPWESRDRPVTLRIASLVCTPGSVGEHREVSKLLAGVRRKAKQMPGARWVIGRSGTDRIDVVRGTAQTIPTPAPGPARFGRAAEPNGAGPVTVTGAAARR